MKNKRKIKVWAIFDHSVEPWIFHNAFRTKKLALEETKTWGYNPKIIRMTLTELF